MGDDSKLLGCQMGENPQQILIKNTRKNNYNTHDDMLGERNIK